ncbi:MAG TPA: hypothetical protein VIM16_06260 [Mucilaginibacter sp.]|jgi:hypothetical protein
MIEPTVSVRIDTFHYENTYKRLCQSDTGKTKKELTFPTMWELFVWGAILGFMEGEPKEIEKPYHTPPFKWQNIKDPHEKLLYIMAVEKTGSFDILRDGEELKRMIENYANAGMNIIQNSLAFDPLAYQNTESLIYEIQNRLTR